MNTQMAEVARLQGEQWAAEVEALDPNDRDAVQAMVGRVPLWWHTIDLGHGVITPGAGGATERLQKMRMPEDLRGKTVLDIGAWDGLFSFEAEKRGAARVVAADIFMPMSFQLARKVLGSHVEFVQVDIRREGGIPDDMGTFDVVFFLGVIYHVPDPLAVLERVAGLTRELMILETDSDLNWLPVPAARLVAGHDKWPELTPRDALAKPECNWWLPNRECLERLVSAAGFNRYEQVDGPPPPPRTRSQKALHRLDSYLPWRLKQPLDSTRWDRRRLTAHCWK